MRIKCSYHTQILLILRRPRSGRLEGRNAIDPATADKFTRSFAGMTGGRVRYL
jgi:hypothetical protein